MTQSRASIRMLLLLIPVLLIVFFVGKCALDGVEQRRIAEEIATAEGLAKVVSETFQDKFEVKVATVTGKQDVTSVNHGTIFTTKQRAMIPYSVDYFINLSMLDRSDLSYNSTSKVLRVNVPDVNIAQPNIDESRIVILKRQGWFRSTQAGENLALRASKLAERGARKSASDPAKLNQARDHARTKIANLLQLPLQTAGLEDVKIDVRFPTDGADQPSFLDHSRSYNEVLEGTAQNAR